MICEGILLICAAGGRKTTELIHLKNNTCEQKGPELIGNRMRDHEEFPELCIRLKSKIKPQKKAVAKHFCVVPRCRSISGVELCYFGGFHDK